MDEEELSGDSSFIIGCTCNGKPIPDIEIVNGELKPLSSVEAEAIRVLVDKHLDEQNR